MFERKLYKKTAKEQLKNNWKLSCVVVGVMIVITYIIQLISNKPAILLNPALSFTFSVLSLFVTGVLSIVITNLFYIISKNKIATVNDIFESFSLWLKGFLGTLWISLWIFLWALLFIIPGFVKAFAYSQMFFILVENPQIGVMKAMRLSKEITKGHKGSLFGMGLSFLGWSILIILPTVIITQLFPFSVVATTITQIITLVLAIPLTAYMQVSFVNAYHYLKQHAIETNVLKAEDFLEN